MLFKVFIAVLLVAATVSIHAIGLAVLLRSLLKSHTRPPTGLWPVTWLLIRVMWWMILVHLAEISVWAGVYFWQGCLPDAASAFYFSGITYTTVGYGDLLLPHTWQLLGPIEGLSGILMCGLSAGVYFAVVSKIVRARSGLQLH